MRTATARPLIHCEWTMRAIYSVRYALTIGELDPGVPKVIALAVLDVRWPDGRLMRGENLSDKVLEHLYAAAMAWLGDPKLIQREVLDKI